jgi:hypothetical protein
MTPTRTNMSDLKRQHVAGMHLGVDLAKELLGSHCMVTLTLNYSFRKDILKGCMIT